MRVTFLLAGGFDLSGGQRIIATYANLLHRRGHQVMVVASPLAPPSLRHRFRALRRGRDWLPNPVQGPSHFDGLDVPRHLLDRARPITDADLPEADVVIATWWETAEWVAALSPGKGVKAHLVQSHEVFDYLPRARVRAVYRLPLRRIVVANWLAEVMRTEYGDEAVIQITQGVDTRLFHSPPRGKQPYPAIGLMYSTTPYKACEVSLRAFALAAQRIPGLRLVAFGSERPSPQLPLPPNTLFTYQPPQTTLKDFYAQCDVWLCGSRQEGFHLPPMEAMACRCPVVSTLVGGPMDYVMPGVNGYLAPAGVRQGQYLD
jgi:glycosyltransferase involved in cell wall biosynthesis